MCAWMDLQPQEVFDGLRTALPRCPTRRTSFRRVRSGRHTESAVHDAIEFSGAVAVRVPRPKAYNADARLLKSWQSSLVSKGSEVATRGLSGWASRHPALARKIASFPRTRHRTVWGQLYVMTRLRLTIYSIAVPEGIAHGPAELQPGSFGTQRDALPGGVITYLPVPMSSADARQTVSLFVLSWLP